MEARTIRLAASFAAALMLGLVAVPASADATSIDVGTSNVVGGVVQVTGTITFGSDLTGPVEVWSDAAGDAVVNGVGLDIAKGTISTNIAQSRLVFGLDLADGLPAPADGPPPAASGFQWPVTVNGEDRTRWLGAGTTGSGNRFADWTGVCHNETSMGGWDCALAVPGTITQAGVTWTVSFSQIAPGVTRGSTIDGGGILCGIPCSIAWPPGLVGSLAPIDTGGFPDTYVVPGKVEVGIAPLGTPPGAVNYNGTGNLTTPSTGAFNGSVSAPATPGDYSLFVKTCGGLQSSLTCAVGTADVTI